MRKIIVQEFLSLDGVMQAPGGREEDPSNGFTLGGWTAPFYYEADQQAEELMGKWLQPADLLLGRKTFDIFEAYWPSHADMWPGIMEVTKYAVSTTKDQSDWNNTVFLTDIKAVENIKNSEGGDINVIGSSKLVQSLFEHALVDEIRLIIYPVILGKGKRLFDENAVPAAFKLEESLVTKNGVIYARYTHAGEVKTGTIGE